MLPGAALVGFAIVYVLQGHPSNISFSADNFIPDLAKPSTLAFAISTIMVFAGIEVMGTRVKEIQDPARKYPRATFSAIALAALVLIPTVLALAVLVPVSELNITAGIVQAIEVVFSSVWVLAWVRALFAVALLLDALGEISGWMAGTPIAMAKASERGFLPSGFGQIQSQAARPMLIGQAIFGSLISIVFIFVPSVEAVFWVLSALLVQLYLLMYMILFASVWQLRRSQPLRDRPWRIPGGWFGVSVVSGVGLVSSIAAFAIGFFPPESLNIGTGNYLAVLGAGLLLSLGAPAVLIVIRERRSGRSEIRSTSTGNQA